MSSCRDKFSRPGLWLELVSAATLTVSHFFVEFETRSGVNSSQVILTNAFLCTVASLVCIVVKKENLLVIREERLFVGLHALIHTSSNICVFFALAYIPAYNVFTIKATVPIVTAVICWIWLGEKLTVLECFIILYVICGLILILQPSILFSNHVDTAPVRDRIIGISLSLISVFTWSATNVVNRKIQATHFLVIELYVVLSITIISLPVMMTIATIKYPKTVSEFLITITISVFFFVGHNTNARALQLEEAVPITIIKNTESIFLLILDMSVLHIIPNYIGFIGMAICLSGVVMFPFTKNVSERLKRCVDRQNTENEGLILNDQT
ncbi:Uncharacterised protein r2_g1624 [Pycnogonum litorale]